MNLLARSVRDDDSYLKVEVPGSKVIKAKPFFQSLGRLNTVITGVGNVPPPHVEVKYAGRRSSK